MSLLLYGDRVSLVSIVYLSSPLSGFYHSITSFTQYNTIPVNRYVTTIPQNIYLSSPYLEFVYQLSTLPP